MTVAATGAGAFAQHGITMQLKIGVMGAATGESEAAHRAAAYDLGEAIARAGCITITGGYPRLPLEAARGAKAAGELVVGISPGLSLDEHLHKYHLPAEFHDILIFTGSGLMGREVVNIRSSDMVATVGGVTGIRYTCRTTHVELRAYGGAVHSV
jgi:uncharacterized protein (TIGR00725 family)